LVGTCYHWETAIVSACHYKVVSAIGCPGRNQRQRIPLINLPSWCNVELQRSAFTRTVNPDSEIAVTWKYPSGRLNRYR